jgi:hypothetical protein
VTGNVLLLIVMAKTVELLETRDPQIIVRFCTPVTMLRLANVMRLYDDRVAMPADDKHPETI